MKASHCCRWLVLLGLLMVAWLPSSQAEIYQWIDENGASHYSQEPPSDGQYRVMTPNPVQPSDAEAAQKRLESLLQQQKASQEARESQQREQQKKAAEQEVRQQRCQQAKQRLADLQNRPRVRITAEDGTVRRLTEEERQERMTQASTLVEEFCRD